MNPQVSNADLAAVARCLVPGACAKSIRALVAYAKASDRYRAGIESAARYARHLAGKAGRAEVIFADVRAAIGGTLLPSDAAIHDAPWSPPFRRPPACRRG